MIDRLFGTAKRAAITCGVVVVVIAAIAGGSSSSNRSSGAGAQSGGGSSDSGKKTEADAKPADPDLSGRCTGYPIAVGDPFRFRLKVANRGPVRWSNTYFKVENVDAFVRNDLRSSSAGAVEKDEFGNFVGGAVPAHSSMTLSGVYVAKSAGRHSVSVMLWAGDEIDGLDHAQSVSCDVVVNPY